jgi:hypothetical protein
MFAGALLVSLATASASRTIGLNVLDFGAKGDGVTDDAAALQAALDAAQAQKRSLLFPAGDYLTSVELVVQCTKYTNGTRTLSRNPVRLVGEGRHNTRIVATREIRSVLHLNNTEEPTIPNPKGGHSANGHEFEGIAFDADGLANHSVFAPATTRSGFHRLGLAGARLSGLYMGYGWINIVSECKFYDNGFALHLENNINSVQVVNNIIESNRGIGIYINGGTAVELTGNCIESAGGPAIVANGVMGLTVRGNYYEANNVASVGAIIFKDESSGKQVGVCTDLVLNGAPADEAMRQLNSTHAVFTLGTKGPLTQAVTVSGNYHNPDNDRCGKSYAGVVAYAAAGVIVEANHASGCAPSTKHPHAPSCTALVTGPSVGNETYRVALNTGSFAT